MSKEKHQNWEQLHKSTGPLVPVVCPRLARLNSADHGWDHLAAWWAPAYMLSPLSLVRPTGRSIMVGPCFPPCKPPFHLIQSIVWQSCSYKRNYRCVSFRFVTGHHTQQIQYILPVQILIGRISRDIKTQMLGRYSPPMYRNIICCCWNPNLAAPMMICTPSRCNNIIVS